MTQHKDIARFRLCELPSRLRECMVGQREYYSATGEACQPEEDVMIWNTRAVAWEVVYHLCGIETPLDSNTPPGIIGDWISENLPNDTDNRLTSRMLWKVQNAYDLMGEQ